MELILCSINIFNYILVPSPMELYMLTLGVVFFFFSFFALAKFCLTTRSSATVISVSMTLLVFISDGFVRTFALANILFSCSVVVYREPS
jgi:hypothetical protein